MEPSNESPALAEPAETDDPIKAALKTLFGLDYLFPYQRLVISNIIEAAEARGLSVNWPARGAPRQSPGPDIDRTSVSAPDMDSAEIQPEASDRETSGKQIVILPTGAGKSLCFQLPAMLLPGPTLVIYPILSLMADQERRLRENGFEPSVIRGGQSGEEREAIWRNVHSGKSRFIIANPEVLLTPRVMERLPSLGLLHLVVDEAHCVSEWGETFRPDYLRIGEIYRAAAAGGKEPMITAFTATASAAVLEKIERYIFATGDSPETRRANRIVGNPDRGNILYSARGVLLRDIAVRDLVASLERPAIVFCSSRPGTEKLARYLRNSLNDSEIRFYHAGLSRDEKTAVEKWFFPNPAGVLVSTCAYGMGVDKADIRTIIHRDCPPSVEAYLQESGRAGRDGKVSRAVLLWGPDDDRRPGRSGAGKNRFEELLRYARNTTACRRDGLLDLLNYEGPRDSPGDYCCDVCGGTASAAFREEAAVIGFIKRNRRLYTLNEAATLMGKAGSLNINEQEAGGLLKTMLWLKKIKLSKNILWRDRLIPQAQVRCHPPVQRQRGERSGASP